jgi:integrase
MAVRALQGNRGGHMARGFTDIAIRNLKAEDKRRELPDPGARGLYVIVEPSGFKSFAVRFRFDGKPKKLSLGNVSLSVARKLAAHALHEVKEGRDPTAAKKQARAERKTIEADTLAAITEKYFAIECGLRRDGETLTFNGKLRSAARRMIDLQRLVLPVLGKRPITQIKRSEIVALLDKIEIERGPTMADRTLAYVGRIFNWHAARDDDFRSPIVRGMTRSNAKERERRRILSDDELRKVWNTEATGPFPIFVKFLLLSAARRNEALDLTWDEIKDGVWVLPAARHKTKTELIRPLGDAALALIESQRGNGSRYVFATSGATKLKTRFDQQTGTSGWTLHDLRRTARSLMSRAGINSDHAERCLGHVIGGSEGVYDRHHYLPEMQRAYDALAALIERIARPPEGNVTPLRKKKRA